MKTSKIISALIALIMLLSVLPLASFAVQSYNLWVGETEVTSNCLSGDGWTFDPATNTLTLDGFNCTGRGHYNVRDGESWNAGIEYSGENKGEPETFNIVLTGKDSVITPAYIDGLDYSYGICVGCDLIISEGANLTVKSCDDVNNSSVAILASTVTIKGGKIECRGGTAQDYSAGISAQFGFTLESGEVYAEGAKSSGGSSFGVNGVFGKICVKDGKLTARSGEAYNVSAGLFCGSDSTLEGGIIDVTGNISNYRGEDVASYAIIGYGNWYIKENVNRFIASAGTSVFNIYNDNEHPISNLIAGRGWDNEAGEGEGTPIEICEEGQILDFKKIDFQHAHSFTAQVASDEYLESAATCTTLARYYKSCKICGLASNNEDDTFTFGNPIAHEWDEGKVTKEPTESADGEIVFTCKTCGETKVESIPKLEAKTLSKPTGDNIVTILIIAGAALAAGAAIIVAKKKLFK